MQEMRRILQMKQWTDAHTEEFLQEVTRSKFFQNKWEEFLRTYDQNNLDLHEVAVLFFGLGCIHGMGCAQNG